MTALPLDPFDEDAPAGRVIPGPWPHRSPHRPRAELIPLLGHDEVWFLGASGLVAHQPTPTGGLMRLLSTGDGLEPGHAACGVLVTREPADASVARCGLCALLTDAQEEDGPSST